MVSILYRFRSRLLSSQQIYVTRLHSSRMRTGRTLTVVPYVVLSWGGGGDVRGVLSRGMVVFPPGPPPPDHAIYPTPPP